MTPLKARKFFGLVEQGRLLDVGEIRKGAVIAPSSDHMVSLHPHTPTQISTLPGGVASGTAYAAWWVAGFAALPINDAITAIGIRNTNAVNTLPIGPAFITDPNFTLFSSMPLDNAVSTMGH